MWLKYSLCIKNSFFLSPAVFIRASDNSNFFRFLLKVRVIGSRLYIIGFNDLIKNLIKNLPNLKFANKSISTPKYKKLFSQTWKKRVFTVEFSAWEASPVPISRSTHFFLRKKPWRWGWNFVWKWGIFGLVNFKYICEIEFYVHQVLVYPMCQVVQSVFRNRVFERRKNMWCQQRPDFIAWTRLRVVSYLSLPSLWTGSLFGEN